MVRQNDREAVRLKKPCDLDMPGLQHSYIYAIQVGLTYLFLPVTHFSAQEVTHLIGPGVALKKVPALQMLP